MASAFLKNLAKTDTRSTDLKSGREHILSLAGDTGTNPGILHNMAVEYRNDDMVLERIANNYAAYYRTLNYIYETTRSADVRKAAVRTAERKTSAFSLIQKKRSAPHAYIGEEEITFFLRASTA